MSSNYNQPNQPHRGPVNDQRFVYDNYPGPASPPPPGMVPAQPYPAYRRPGPGMYGTDPVTGLPYSSKSKVAAGLLGIFLGGLGVGRFYTGHVGLGIAQLLVSIFTLGTLGVLWGFIDGIVILCGESKDSDGFPLR